MGSRKHGLLKATSIIPWCLINPIAVAVIGGLDCRADLESKKAWVKKFIPVRI